MSSLQDELLACALRIAGQGWPLFPCMPGAKRPAVDRWHTVADTDPDRIRRCWASGAWNIGVHAGAAGLVIIDCDVAKPDTVVPDEYAGTSITTGRQVLADLEGANDELPATFTVATPSGGTHLYFTAPIDPPGDIVLSNTAGRLGWLIDTRASNGYVLGPGSRIDGRAYTVTDPTPPAPLPGWITNQLAAPDTDTTPSTLPADERQRSNYVAAAVRAELTRVAAARRGQRNHVLFSAAAALGELVAAGELDQSIIHAALAAAADTAGLDAHEIPRTIASGLRAGAERPRTTEGTAA